MKKKYKSSKSKFNSFNSFENKEDKNEMVNKYLSKNKEIKSESKSKYYSIGESKLELILSSLNIEYVREYEFKDCINKLTNKKLRFDFYLPTYNTLIEYDGRQHHSLLSNQQGNDFHSQVYRDLIKNKYCDDNNIKLIRIKSNDYSNLENKINEIIYDLQRTNNTLKPIPKGT